MLIGTDKEHSRTLTAQLHGCTLHTCMLYLHIARALLRCCSVAMLQRCIVVLLQCCTLSMLLCCTQVHELQKQASVEFDKMASATSNVHLAHAAAHLVILETGSLSVVYSCSACRSPSLHHSTTRRNSPSILQFHLSFANPSQSCRLVVCDTLHHTSITY
jgi:hypothetical protein